MQIILLSGGSGTRLWPLSNNSRSKQFLKVLRNSNGKSESMVQRTYRKISSVAPTAKITIATCATQVQSIAMQLVVVEPERRDTASAIMLACANLAYRKGVSPDETVVVMPIDTYADDGYYATLLKLDFTVQQDVAELTLMGVKPSFPSTKYGYIVPTTSKDAVQKVSTFQEKPAKEMAQELIEKGALWNCGVFAFKLRYMVDILSVYTDIKDFDELVAHYSDLPKNSFDYEVVEKAESVAVVPCDASWKDLGTWNTLSEEMADNYSGRAVIDEKTCEKLHVINETGLPLVVAGISDAVVIATHDGILVSGKQESAYIKKQVEEAAASRPMYESRRWGEYRVIDVGLYPDGNKALTKELIIGAGKQLSYQLHEHRSEIWTIVSGSGQVVLDDVVADAKCGDVIQVAKGVKHSVRAFRDLHVIEVQLGDVLEEEDIRRFGNYWDD